MPALARRFLAEGHLIDSGLLTRMLNIIVDEGADYTVIDFAMGKVRTDASRVELETDIRPSLIGGVVAESEGQEIEYSIEGELKDLAAQLSAGEQDAAGTEGIEGRQDHAHQP